MVAAAHLFSSSRNAAGPVLPTTEEAAARGETEGAGDDAGRAVGEAFARGDGEGVARGEAGFAGAMVAAGDGLGVLTGVPGFGYDRSEGTETSGSERTEGSEPRRLSGGVGEASASCERATEELAISMAVAASSAVVELRMIVSERCTAVDPIIGRI